MDQTQATTLKANFDRDGFVILRNFVPIEQVKEITRRAEAVTTDRSGSGAMFSNVTKGLEWRDDYFKELLMHGPHVPVLEMLLERKPEPTTASFFTKNKNDEEVHPHSDAMSGGVMWIALDEVNENNGCLHFLKGSHKKEEEFKHLRASEPTDLSDHPDLVEAAMQSGDMVLFRPTTVHWSGPNQDGSVRRGFNCFYVGSSIGRGKKKPGYKKWEAAKKKKFQLA